MDQLNRPQRIILSVLLDIEASYLEASTYVFARRIERKWEERIRELLRDRFRAKKNNFYRKLFKAVLNLLWDKELVNETSFLDAFFKGSNHPMKSIMLYTLKQYKKTEVLLAFSFPLFQSQFDQALQNIKNESLKILKASL